MARPISDQSRPRLARGVRLQIDCTTGKGVLLHPEGVVELNETAHDILTRCDGSSLGEIVAALAGEYEVTDDTMANDVRETIDDLRKRNLLELE